ncbi:hypothetical protein [Streptomyces sp. NPDC060065]|uniref:hypothetical protein n=1 Tax=Streptomyces sp. NPDC060065 TaxID=3347050 RepID=UPI0036BF9861
MSPLFRSPGGTHGTGVTAAAFHSGVVASEVGRDSAVNRVLMGLRPVKALMHTPDQGAEQLTGPSATSRA